MKTHLTKNIRLDNFPSKPHQMARRHKKIIQRITAKHIHNYRKFRKKIFKKKRKNKANTYYIKRKKIDDWKMFVVGVAWYIFRPTSPAFISVRIYGKTPNN